MTPNFENEFSRPIVLLQIGNRESRHTIAVEPKEREALAKRLRVASLDQLEGTIVLRRVRGGTAFSASGRLQAEVTQTCVATLEPLPTRVDEEFAETFEIPETHASSEEKEVEFFLDDEVEPAGPELLSSGSFDLGEFLVQLLAERLDPYPRSSTAPPQDGEWGAAEDIADPGPFAGLARKLKRQ